MAVALFCAFASGVLEGEWIEHLARNILLAGCGLLITHGLRLWMIRKRLPDLPVPALILRVAPAIPLMALIYIACAWLTGLLEVAILHKPIPIEFSREHLEFLLFDFVNSIFIFGSWVSIYAVCRFRPVGRLRPFSGASRRPATASQPAGSVAPAPKAVRFESPKRGQGLVGS
jgi:hypothetical protein